MSILHIDVYYTCLVSKLSHLSCHEHFYMRKYLLLLLLDSRLCSGLLSKLVKKMPLLMLEKKIKQINVN